MIEELSGKGLLIHHWDTDGICSARILLEKLNSKNIINKTPELGNYFLTEKELSDYSKYDFIIIADMSLPEKNILNLEKNSKIIIFDHHLGKEIKQVTHHNPIIKGENPNKYPSASWIINDFLNNSINLYALLGIIGDHEKKIRNNNVFFKIITDFCKNKKLDFDDLLKMVYLLDTNYKLGNKEGVETAPLFLLNYIHPQEILNNTQWNKNLTILNKEITKQLQKTEEEIKGIILKKIETPYNIISTITRKVAWENEKNTMVINTGFFNDKDQIYVRSSKNLGPMIQRGKNLGFKCGGKKEVLGAILPKDKTDSFVKEIIDFLS